MRKQLIHHVLAAIATTGLLLPATLAAAGPDLAISALPDTLHFGPVGDIHGYTVGFTVCNVGTTDLAWVSNTNQHPVQGTAMYRLSNGRFEQIGFSWLKHGFFAGSAPGCGPCNGVSGSMLGVGCADTYSAELNAFQAYLGPRFEVNPSTGVFPYPFTEPGGSGNAVSRMCQVRQADLNSPGSLYFVEGQVIHPEDAPAGSAANNNSHRRITFNASFVGTLAGATVPFEPAIRAWKANGLGLGVMDPDLQEIAVDIPGDGRFWIAAKASNVGAGVWRYEYAVMNLNSHRSGGSFSVPLPPGAIVSNIGFHDVDYHSGEPFDNIDWVMTQTASAVTWASPQTFAQNPNTNALRWGTMDNFRFDADRAPGNRQAALGLFRPDPARASGLAGSPDSVWITLPGPIPVCPADVNQSGAVNIDDLLLIISHWGLLGNDPADITGNGIVNIDDLLAVISAWGACP